MTERSLPATTRPVGVHRDVQLDSTTPGWPVENVIIENLSGRLRDEFLNAYWLESLASVRVEFMAWQAEYNEA
jgi:hypothetical protein